MIVHHASLDSKQAFCSQSIFSFQAFLPFISPDGKPKQEGAHTITIRDIDQSGNVQESLSFRETLFKSFPDGAKVFMP